MYMLWQNQTFDTPPVTLSFFQLLYIQQERSENVTTVTLFLVIYSKWTYGMTNMVSA